MERHYEQEELRREADRMLQTRLGSIEDELRQLRALLERLVRVEERLTSQGENEKRRAEEHTKLERLVHKLEERVRKLEGGDVKQNYFIGGLERLLWIAVAALLAWLGSRFGK